ncbi:MAG: penicillin-insensitive murein endopeptidase [Pseudomonadota bacterium]
MAQIAPQDNRSYFVLPQAYEGGGYYTYGLPGSGRSQYAHPALISLLMQVATRWCGMEQRKFGVGDISLANGIPHPDHRSHRNGLQVDIRPLRKDGKELACSRLSAEYDRDGTAKLIGLFGAIDQVQRIFFNDHSISGVRPYARHDDHFHVEVRVSKGKL